MSPTSPPAPATGKTAPMSETYGRTDMHYCGCVEDADGYITAFCTQHGGLYLPPAREEEDPDGPEPWAASPVIDNARQRAAELFAASDDENWLGI
jgi:hypothetical protein